MTADSAASVTWDQVLAWRIDRHRLIRRAPARDFVRVAGEICGLHAQLMSSAELSLWARTDGLEREAVARALWEDRTLVKLWAMRGTLHLLPADELGLWLAALGTYTHYGNTSPEIDQIAEAVAGALDGRPLTRGELADEVERRTGSTMLGEWVRESWGTSLKAVTFRGLLCFASSEGGRVRFTTPARWLPAAVEQPEPADALGEVARRFLRAYAPVSADQFAIWGGFGRAKVARMVAALGEEAVEIDVEGERGWALARDVAEIARAEPADVARLLPAFDPWVIGAARGSPAQLHPRHRSRVYRAQGWISPVLLVNGRMVGVWRHERKGRRLVVELEPFGRLPASARTPLEAEAERLAGFLGGELELRRAA
jgi:uncharacterized protein YcaQ